MNEALIRRHAERVLAGAACLLLVALAVGCGQEAGAPATVAPVVGETQSQPPAIEPVEEPASGEEQAEAAHEEAADESAPGETVEVGSCDGENTVTVPKDLTGQELAHALMDQWLRDHPEANWVTEEREKHAFQPPADNSDLLQGEQGKSHAYGNYTEHDILTWAREAEKFVAEGSRIFHSAGELGSTVGVSCDMCHPHAANTHPETYPKFQVQLGRVALLRDMIDWCVENPVRGAHLDPDGPTMRALEAYIMAQRKGVEMNYGKH